MAALLGACATPSFNSGCVVADEPVKQIVAEGGWSEEAMAQVAIVQNPDFQHGKISAETMKTIERYAVSCQEQIAPQAPNFTSGPFAGPSIAAAKGQCVKDFFGDLKNHPATAARFYGTHVEVMVSGKRRGDSKPPALADDAKAAIKASDEAAGKRIAEAKKPAAKPDCRAECKPEPKK